MRARVQSIDAENPNKAVGMTMRGIAGAAGRFARAFSGLIGFEPSSGADDEQRT
jgi:hypothetical protein